MLTNLEFKYPSNIIFLLLAIAAVACFILAFGKKEKILAALRLGFKMRFKALRAVLLGAALVLMVIALMGPQVFRGYGEVNKTGMDIYVLVDTSKSMLVTDINPDRLTVAKRIAETLLDNLNGDRIGFIPFASAAYIQMPLTDDYQLARMFLDVMDTEMISGGGTNLAAAIKLANDSFVRSSSADRVILILSDGEEHDSSSVDALKKVKDEQVKIFTVGIGTEKGGLVPVLNNAGDKIIDYMKDEGGNPITSRLNANILEKLAKSGRGAYYQATLQGSETTALLEDLSALKRDAYEMIKIKRFQQLFQYFLGPGILLFMIAWFLPERRKTA